MGLTSIVIVTANGLECTRQCLESVRRCTPLQYEIIAIDNGSTDGTVEYLRSAADVKLIENPINRGVPAAINQGLCKASGDYIVLLNNDVVVPPGWLERMVSVLKRDTKIGLVGPCSNNVSGVQRVAAPYRQLSELDAFAESWVTRNAGRTIPTTRLVGFCLLLTRDAFEHIGLMDERFGLGNFEDDDYCRRAVLAGYQPMVATEVFVHHGGSQTFQALGLNMTDILQHNRAVYRRKWADMEQHPAGDLNHKRAGQPPVVRPEVLRGTLSLCMIARDSARTLPACLESIRPWVDEMIVVDTGSADHTVAIARDHGAKVSYFAWCDDFSAARNHAIRQASGEWIFWMDSDDTIDVENGRRLRDLIQLPVARETLGFILQVRCPLKSGNNRSDATVVDHVKVFRNLPYLEFEGRVHEQVLPAIRRATGNVEWTDIFVEHSGADYSPEGRKCKHQRDLKLIQLELKDNPNHPFHLFNLGMTYADMNLHAQAVRALEKSIAVARIGETHLRKAYALLAGSYSRLSEPDRAIEVCRRGVGLYPEDAELLFLKGVLAQRLGYTDEAERSYRLLMEGNTQRYFASVDSGIKVDLARHNLATLYLDTQLPVQAAEQWNILLKQQSNYIPAWEGLVEALLKQQCYNEAIAAVDKMLASGDDPELALHAEILQAQIALAQGAISDAQLHFEAAATRNPDHPLLKKTWARFTFEHASPDQALEALLKLQQQCPEDAATCHNLGIIFTRLGQLDQAIEQLEKSLKLRPNFPATREVLAAVRMQQTAPCNMPAAKMENLT
jgi:GT2 family glycosyltransferase/tetratricopeptide (TPR) repeat protein